MTEDQVVAEVSLDEIRATEADIKILEEEFENLLKESNEKYYLVSGGLEMANKLRNWIINDAEWTYQECRAIVKIKEALDEAIKNIETKKTTELVLQAIVLNALNYMFQKVKGVGYASASILESLVVAVVETLNGSVAADNKKLEELSLRMQSLQQGIEVEDEHINETENE